MKLSSENAASRTPAQQRGVVLIVVLWVMALLAVIVLSFGQAMRVEMQISHSYTDRLKALELAKSGIARAMADLAADATDYDDFDDPWYSNEEEYREVALGDGTYTLLNIGYEDDSAPSFGLVDEAAKINFNTATREMLSSLPGMDYAIADAIIDWRDEDDIQEPEGAESEYYESLDPSYFCKNAPFETVEELLLVAGVTREILYGEDWNRNGMLDANENDGDASDPPDNGDGVLDRGLADFVTVYTREPSEERENQADEGQGDGGASGQASQEGLININTAPYEVLHALPGIDEDAAYAIVDFRETTADVFENPEWVRRTITAQQYTQIQDLITTTSYQFRAHAIGKIAGKPVFKRIEVVIDRASQPFKILYWRDLTHLGPPIQFEDAER